MKKVLPRKVISSCLECPYLDQEGADWCNLTMNHINIDELDIISDTCTLENE